MRPGIYTKLGLVIVFTAMSLVAGCEQPVLESPACTEARDPVRKLYSLHIDGGPNPKNEKLERMREFISDDLFSELKKVGEMSADYLTKSKEFPKAFRLGACSDSEKGVEIDILLFWTHERTSRQNKVVVSAVNNNEWVVDRVRMAK